MFLRSKICASNQNYLKMNIPEKVCFIVLFRGNKTCHSEYFQSIVDIFSSYNRYILWGLFLMPWPVLQIICSLVHLGIKYCILSILWSCNTFSLRVFDKKYPIYHALSQVYFTVGKKKDLRMYFWPNQILK